jgi:soluble lytic murein transglycosylase-like protein
MLCLAAQSSYHLPHPPLKPAVVVQQKEVTTYAVIRAIQPTVDPEIASLHAKYIDYYSLHYHLDRFLVIAIAMRESEFNAGAVSRKGCIGAMQVNPMSHKEELKHLGITRTELFHLRNNYDIGCSILRTCLNDSSSVDVALTKYVGGRHSTYRKDVRKIYAECKKIS